MTQNLIEKPEILAPAGGRASFLAAIAAGADAVYCGLTHFSARMAAENFTVDELSALARLARKKHTKVYVALNTLVKPDEMDTAGEMAVQLTRNVKPDGLIVSDTAMVSLASQAGFSGEIHLSTLANTGFPSAMKAVSLFPSINRVVVPRELSVDEIRKMADACPPGLSLEVFVHGPFATRFPAGATGAATWEGKAVFAEIACSPAAGCIPRGIRVHGCFPARISGSMCLSRFS